jgi:leukotriene-A4 hydrolase
VVFLKRLSAFRALPSSHVSHLSTLYKFSQSQNAEIRLRFYEVALLDPDTHAAKTFASEAADWVVGADGSGTVKGRMKFCRPIFKAVYKVSKSLAVDVFTRSKASFHPIAIRLIEKVCMIFSQQDPVAESF